ncbi:hypothetical protein LTR85_008062 [Meristemomyces frigidus]|nr:hypothetical protein LTR85_008062 [Meristemomyces frigidus]
MSGAVESHAGVEASVTVDERCHILRLPKELRLIIYEELLSLEKIYIESYDTPSIRELSEYEVATTRFYVYRLEGSASPHILRTCRQIY